MSIFILLSLFSVITMLFLGNWVYFLNPKKMLNKVFFLCCLSVSFWAFAEFMFRQAETTDSAYLWMKISITWPFTLAFFLHFVLVFTEKIKFLANKLSYILIYCPAVIFSVIDISTNSINAGVAKDFWGYTFVPQTDSWIFWIAQIWIYITGFSALVLCIKYGFRSTERRKKSQAKYMSIAFSLPLLSGLISELVVPSFLNFEIPSLAITSMAVLGVISAYAIWKYSLFSLDPASAAENIISTMPNFLILTDIEGKILRVNQSLITSLGYKEVELVGKSTNILFAEEPWVDNIKQKELDAGFLKDHETKWKTKSGEPLIVNFSMSFVKDKEGQRIGIVCIAHDITESKKAEESFFKTMNELVLVNEKLNVVGSLTRHDVRNKLAAVNGYAYLLKKKHADQADIIDGLEKIEQAVKDSGKIFDFAKMYEQLGVEELTYIKVEEKLREAFSLFSAPLPKMVDESHGLVVLADSFLMQFFYNLIDNTRKYGQKTTTIKVRYEKMDMDRLRLIYEDDGVGVPSENKSLLFKEGFSTGGSTGFGLFLTKKMMDVYGWEIEENGIPGEGARFVIILPKLGKNEKETYQVKEGK